MRRLALTLFLFALAFGVHRFLRKSNGDVAATIRGQSEGRSNVNSGESKKILQRVQDLSAFDAQKDPSTNQEDALPPSRESAKTTDALSATDKQIERSEKKISKDQSPIETRMSELPKSPRFVINPNDAKGAVHALYQAILWRKPDNAGGTAAAEAFSRIGWQTYLGNAKDMISSREFFERIAPIHSDESIINRMYAIFLNRCSSPHEMQDHIGHLRDNETGKVTTSILNKAIDENKQQIFEGGYKPESCPTVE